MKRTIAEYIEKFMPQLKEREHDLPNLEKVIQLREQDLRQLKQATVPRHEYERVVRLLEQKSQELRRSQGLLDGVRAMLGAPTADGSGGGGAASATAATADAEQEEDEDAVVVRKAKLVLNELTIEKFDKLSDEFIQVGFTSKELLQKAVNIIVDKAQMEHHFGPMCADLCLKLARKLVRTPLENVDEGDTAGKAFKKLLLQRCQEEFEKDMVAVLADLEAIEEEDSRNEQILLERKRYMGHMKFVGELFRVSLLSDRIMHACVKELFGDLTKPDEEKIQCLCTLLTTIGHQLEDMAHKHQGKKPEHVTYVQKYFKYLKELGRNSALSGRIRVMCQDLLEMRNNNWNA